MNVKMFNGKMSTSNCDNYYIDRELSTESVGIDSMIQSLSNWGRILIYYKLPSWGIVYLRRALMLSKQFDRKGIEGRAIGQLAEVYISSEKYEEALELQTRHLEIVQDLNNVYGQASIYRSLVGLHFKLGNYNDALRCAGNLLICSRAIKNINFENLARTNINELRMKLMKPQFSDEEIDFIYLGIVPIDSFVNPIANFDVEMTTMQDVGNMDDLWHERHARGVKFLEEKEYDKAMECFAMNVELSEKQLKNHVFEAKSKVFLGICLTNLRRFNAAIRYFDSALNIALMYDDHLLKMNIFLHLKLVHNSFATDLHNLNAEWMTLPMPKCSNFKNTHSIVEAYERIENDAYLHGDISKNYEEMGNLEYEIGNSKNQIDKFEASFELGKIFFELGKYVEAEHQYNNAFTIYRTLSLPCERFAIYSNMYENYCKLNKIDAAYDILQRFVLVSDTDRNKDAIKKAYMKLCDICSQIENHPYVIRYAKELQALGEQDNDPDTKEYAKNTITRSINILYCNVMEERLQKAGKRKCYSSANIAQLQKFYKDQLQKAILWKDNELKADSLMNIAHIDVYLKNYTAAVFNYENAIQLTTNPTVLFEIQIGLADGCHYLNDLEIAITYYEDCANRLSYSPSSDLDHCYVYWVLSCLYLKTENYENGKKYIDLHYDIAKKLNDKGGMRVAIQNIAFMKQNQLSKMCKRNMENY